MMLWTACLILFVLWLLALLLDIGGRTIHILPAVIAVLLLARVASGIRRL